MIIRELQTLEGARAAEGLCVVIDVFRACTTACAIAVQRPRRYVVVGTDHDAEQLRRSIPDAVLIGKAGLGSSLAYDLPNSPTRVASALLTDRFVVHRTTAGTRGVLAATAADEIILGAFVNAAAVAAHVRRRQPALVSLVCVGHEGSTPSAEDVACAACITALIEGREATVPGLTDALRATTGRYFFADDDAAYPRDDFGFCLARDRFDFVLRATRERSHAVLEPVNVA